MSVLRPIFVLISGAALAHGVTAISLPILSRMYSPEEFSVLAVFTSVLSVISVAACLRFDVAVSIPERDNEALNLMALAIAFVTLVSGLLLLVILIAPSWLAEKMKIPQIRPYLWMLPIGVFSAGIFSALQYWFIRDKSFSLIARARVLQSISGAGVQFVGGMMMAGPIGLLLGYVMTTGVACLALGYRFCKKTCQKADGNGITWPQMRAVFKNYQRYPKYSTFEALCNSAAIQLPVLMIAAMAQGPEAGYLALAMSVMQAPMALFGSAVGQVYLAHAPKEFRAGQLGIFTAETLAGLLKAGVGPLIVAGLLAPIAFGFVFGEGWERAGWIVAWMTPWFVMQFLASPISTALHVTGHQRAALMLQIFGLCVRVLGVWIVGRWNSTFITEAYAVSGMLTYTIYLILVLFYVEVSCKKAMQVFLQNIPIIMLWIVPAILLMWLVR